MRDLNSLFWVSFDAIDPVFAHTEVEQWPADQFNALLKLGLIQRTASTNYVVCPTCPSGHDEEVITVADADGDLTFWIRCPEALRVEIPASDLQRWTIDFECAAEALSESLKLSGRRSVRIPSRLWRLGRTQHRGAWRDVFLARGLAWPDGAPVASAIHGVGRAIVLIGDSLPQHIASGLSSLCLTPLSQVGSVSKHGLDLDAIVMAQMVDESDALAQEFQILPLDDNKKKLFVRRQVKAEIKSLLTDDALIAAYKEHGSLRTAALAMTKQMGQEITKDKIKRAIDRHGGIEAIRSTQDSSSVARTVASRSCDRQKKILERR